MSIEQVGQTSSMGVVWPPIPYTNERLRGFYTESVIRTVKDSAEFAALFAEQRAILDESNNLTRLSYSVHCACRPISYSVFVRGTR